MPHFRDPIHGFIYVSHEEQKIIDSAPFQRLRNIRQLATTYLVYHGAEHTRFGHSIGVMHLADRTFSSVASKTPRLFDSDDKLNTAKITWYKQILRLIALTHDLGHPAFSHAGEDLMPEGRKHEHYTERIIKETSISEIISEIGKDLHMRLATELGISEDLLINAHNIRPITPDLLWMIYGEKPDITNNNYIWPDFVFLKAFMDGELDCDKMDYLLRDSYYCGVTYGTYDLNRFVSTLIAHKNESENTLHLAITSGGIQAFEEFVLARYFMFIQVYFQRTRRYFDHILTKAMREVLDGGKLPEDVYDYIKLDDVSMIQRMKNANSPNAIRYINREVMSCLYSSPAHASRMEYENIKLRMQLLQKDFPGIAFHLDSVDKLAHKLLPTKYSRDTDSNDVLLVIDHHTGEAKNIADESLILEGVIKAIYICRIYTDAKDDVLEAISNSFKQNGGQT